MRLAVLTFGLLFALPAAAADRTEQIRLRHIQTAELEAVLMPTMERGSELSLRAVRSTSHISVPMLPMTQLMPDGITAWSFDTRKNLLNVTGEPAAIDRLRTIIKLVDLQPSQVRLSVRLLNLGEQALKSMNVEQLAFDGADGSLSHLVVAVLDKVQATELAKLPAQSNVEMVTSNNRAMYFRWPRVDAPEASLTAILPRINGDRSVTLLLPARIQWVVNGQVSSTQSVGLRRVAAGQTLLLKAQGEGLTAMVTVKEVITHPAKKRK